MSYHGSTLPKPNWLDLTITQIGETLTVSARAENDMQTGPHPLEISFQDLIRFAQEVKSAASSHAPLTRPLLDQGQNFYRALLFQPDISALLNKLKGAAGDNPILLRLSAGTLDLKAIPWEALRMPNRDMIHLGTSPYELLTRSVHSMDAFQPRQIQGIARILVISPFAGVAEQLRSKLVSHITDHSFQWLTPIEGQKVTLPFIREELQRYEPRPHILHFIGHGGIDDKGAYLEMLFDEGEAKRYYVEYLAQDLSSGGPGNLSKGDLRLVILESCNGAHSGGLTSAAESLLQHGANAVLAHLWPATGDTARVCTSLFYKSLLQLGTHSRGNVAASLHEARRGILTDFNQTAEAFSPVLYLRGVNPILFDFRDVERFPPVLYSSATPAASGTSALEALKNRLQRPLSLLLGDHWPLFDAPLRAPLEQGLAEVQNLVPKEVLKGLPLSTLAQWYTLQFGEDSLKARFEDTPRRSRLGPPTPLVKALAPWLQPGFHLTLLRHPVLEDALCEARPDRPFYVIRPSPNDSDRLCLQHQPGKGWKYCEKLPDSFNSELDIVLVQLYHGYLPTEEVCSALHLTEDDYLRDEWDLRRLLPDVLAEQCIASLESRPTLLVGMDALAWNHRLLLRGLFKKALPRSSAILLDHEDPTREYWRTGRCLPGRKGIQTENFDLEGLGKQLSGSQSSGGRA